jgi:hypothetical protein
MTVLYLLIFLLLLISFKQFLTIRKYKKLFNRLSEVYSKDKNTDVASLVQKIIVYGQLNRPLPPSEVIEMISDYIKDFFATSRVFIHITNDKNIAENILAEGFMYSEDFYRSTEEISNEKIDLIYKLYLHKFYGKYLIIMSIPSNLFLKAKQDNTARKDIDLLAEIGISEYYPDNDLHYKLSSKYVSGYVDIDRKQIIKNPL